MKTGVILTSIASFSLAACTSTTLTSTAAKTPKWTANPSKPNPYYINSVAASADGTKVVGGTFYHAYSATEERAPANTPPPASSGSTGTFGTYCYDQSGNLLWKDEFNGYEGVYWVDISQSGAYAASGGWYSNNPYNGFVRAYAVSTGSKLLDYRTAKRVNQVVVSADGTWLVSAAETVVLFQLVNGTYQKSAEFTPTTPNDTIETIAMSANGQSIVFGDYAGGIYLLANQQGTLSVTKQWSLPSGGYSHSVRMTPDGSAFAAGGAAGYFYLFDVAQFISTGQPTISYQTPNKGSVYGVAIADDGSAFVGISNLQAGSNVGGLVYYLQRAGSQAKLLWQYQTARNPNSASLNLAKGMLAVADGHPDGYPGDFYLLNTADGTLRWQYTTTNMSWPITIAQNGTAVVAGSDDSNIYYFIP